MRLVNDDAAKGPAGAQSFHGVPYAQLSELVHADRLAQGAIALVGDLSRILDALSVVNFGALGSEERLQVTADLGIQATRLGALRDIAVGALSRDGTWKGHGSRTLPDFIRQSSKSSSHKATKLVTRAKALEEHLPEFRKAFIAGEIDSEKVEVVSQYCSESGVKEKLRESREVEHELLRIAKSKNTDAFRRSVKAWAMRQSPKIAEENHRQRVREERVSLVQESEGFAIRGWFTTLNGEILQTALAATMGVPSKGDTRQPLERRAGALVEIARQYLDAGNSNSAATVRPHLSIHVPFEVLERIAPTAEHSDPHELSGSIEATASTTASHGEFDKEAASPRRARTSQCNCRVTGTPRSGAASEPAEANSVIGGRQGFCMHEVQRERSRAGEILGIIKAGIEPDLLTGSPPATLDDGTPINYSELQTLLCSGELQRIVLSQAGEVLDVGRRYRTATSHQARAVIARDRTCRFPGCDHTIGSSEIHHANYWSNHGPTDIDNLVMLCWYHHKLVHQEAMTITHHHKGWVFSSPRGYVSTTWHGLDNNTGQREVDADQLQVGPDEHENDARNIEWASRIREPIQD